MRCKDCPAFKVDGFAHCLLVFPYKPKQLIDPDENADYCKMWDKYKAFSEEADSQIDENLKFNSMED